MDKRWYMAFFASLSCYLIASTVAIDESELFEDRIINGQPVDSAANMKVLSFVVRIVKRRGLLESYCGGSLISDKWVLTSASCVFEVKNEPSNVAVFINNFRVLVPSGNEQIIPIESIQIHDGFNQVTKTNDIALVKLLRPVVMNTGNSVKPICLPRSSYKVQVNQTGAIAGWSTIGNNPRNKSLSEVWILRYGYANVENLTTCKSKYIATQVQDNNLCATTNNAFCWTDRGGPLITKYGDNSLVLSGIMSFDNGCLNKTVKKPGVYTDVSKHASWIGEKAGIVSCYNGTPRSVSQSGFFVGILSIITAFYIRYV